MIVTDRLETRLRQVAACCPAERVEELVGALKIHEALRARAELQAFLHATEPSQWPRRFLLVGRIAPDGRPECRPLAVAIVERWVRIKPARPADGLRLVVTSGAGGRAYWLDGDVRDLDDILRGAGPIPEPVDRAFRAVAAAWGMPDDLALVGEPAPELPPELLARVRASLGQSGGGQGPA
jgi:hypothetical protein